MKEKKECIECGSNKNITHQCLNCGAYFCFDCQSYFDGYCHCTPYTVYPIFKKKAKKKVEKKPLTEGKMKTNIKKVKPGLKPKNPPPPHPKKK